MSAHAQVARGDIDGSSVWFRVVREWTEPTEANGLEQPCAGSLKRSSSRSARWCSPAFERDHQLGPHPRSAFDAALRAAGVAADRRAVSPPTSSPPTPRSSRSCGACSPPLRAALPRAPAPPMISAGPPTPHPTWGRHVRTRSPPVDRDRSSDSTFSVAGSARPASSAPTSPSRPPPGGSRPRSEGAEKGARTRVQDPHQVPVRRRAELWEKAKTHLDTVERSGDGLTGEAEDHVGRHEQGAQRVRRTHQGLVGSSTATTARPRRSAPSSPASGPLATLATAPATRAAPTPTSCARDRQRRDAQPHLRGRRAPRPTAGTATDGKGTVPTSFRASSTSTSCPPRRSAGLAPRCSPPSRASRSRSPRPPATRPRRSFAEAGPIGESDPQFGQVTLGVQSARSSSARRASCSPTRPSTWCRSWPVRVAALGLGSSAHFVNGDGSDKPQGIVGASTTGRPAPPAWPGRSPPTT